MYLIHDYNNLFFTANNWTLPIRLEFLQAAQLFTTYKTSSSQRPLSSKFQFFISKSFSGMAFCKHFHYIVSRLTPSHCSAFLLIFFRFARRFKFNKFFIFCNKTGNLIFHLSAVNKQLTHREICGTIFRGETHDVAEIGAVFGIGIESIARRAA